MQGKNDIKIGFLKTEEIILGKDEQMEHLFIVSGGVQSKSNLLLTDIFKQKLTTNQGIIFFQGVKTPLKEAFISKVKTSNRKDDVYVIDETAPFDDKDKLCELVVQLIFQSRIVYVNLDGRNKQTFTRAFMQALRDAIERLRKIGGSSQYNQCNLITTGVEEIQSSTWYHIINFARIANIAVINTLTDFAILQQLKSDLNPMYNIVDHLWGASMTQILFDQNSHDQNIELSRITGIRVFTLAKDELHKSKAGGSNNNVALSKLENRQYIMLYQGGATAVKF